VTMRERLRAIAQDIARGKFGVFTDDNVAALRALADRIDAEEARMADTMPFAPIAEAVRRGCAALIARLDAAPSQSGDAK